MKARGVRKWRTISWSVTVLSHIYIYINLPLTGPLPSGSRQIQLSVPGAYEKPQLVPLQPTMESPTFTFHVNPVLSPKLHMELGKKPLVLQVC